MMEIVDQILQQIEELFDAKIQKLQQMMQKKIDLHDALLKLVLENLNQMKDQLQPEIKPYRFKHSVSQSVQFVKDIKCCCVCNNEIFEDEIETQCHHFYHQICLQKKAKSQIDMGFPVLQCIGKIGHRLCYGRIKIQECNFMNESQILNINFNNQALKLMGQLTTCPMHDCNYFFKLNQNFESAVNLCNKCNKSFCYDCLVLCDQNHMCSRKQVRKQMICKFCNRCGALQIYLKLKPNLECTQCRNMIFL